MALARAHPSSASPLVPFLAAALGIALFTSMDAVMKGLSLVIGAYCAMVWRTILALGPTGAVLILRPVRRPTAGALWLHLQRGAVNAFSAVGYFFGLTRLPMAEGIALSFVAPLVALYFSSVLLKEKVGGRAIAASLLGIAGVMVMVAARMTGRFETRALEGAAAILVAATVYGYGLVLLRKQAQIASPAELAFYQNGATLLWLLPGAPFLAFLPEARHWPALLLGAVLAQASMMLLGWAYARAEAKVLIPVEYTGFVWSAILGALMFGEKLTGAVVAGAMLIVTGCAIAARAKAPPPPMAAEVSL